MFNKLVAIEPVSLIPTAEAKLKEYAKVVVMHSVPNWQGDDHKITAEIDGVKAIVDIYSRTSAIAGWSVVALLRNLSSPVCFF